MATLAAFLTASHPFLIYHAVDGQTHTSEAFVASLLVYGIFAYRNGPTLAKAAALGGLLALGSAFRPTFVVLGLGPVLWAIRMRWSHLLVAGMVSVVGAALWVFPTFSLSGGYERWKVANDAWVQDAFFNKVSPFGSGQDAQMASINVKNVFIWVGLLVAPLVPLLGVRFKARSTDGWRAVRAISLTAVLPATVFYLAIFCSEPGYFEGLVPIFVILVVVSIPKHMEGGWRKIAVGAVFIIQLAILMLPGDGAVWRKVPSIPDLISRQVFASEYVRQATEGVEPGARALVVTDSLGSAILRQFPLLRPGNDVLWIHNRYWRSFDHTAISYATEEGWTPIPGPVMFADGPPTVLETERVYDYVIVAMNMTEDGRAKLALNTRCSLRSEDGGFVVLPVARCFPEGGVVFDGQGVRFGVSRDALGERPSGALP